MATRYSTSGPMHGIAYRSASIAGFTPVGNRIFDEVDGWWPKAYAPLIWASEQSWGEPIWRYWNLFPIVREIE